MLANKMKENTRSIKNKQIIIVMNGVFVPL